MDRLKIVFSEDVGRSLSLSDFRLTASVVYTALGIPVGTLPKILNYSYDSSTFTATLALSNALPAAVFDLTVAAGGVFDREAANLDGEWINGVTAGSSGNGVAGGDFAFRIFVLPGDVRDETGGVGTRTVNSNDSQRVRDKQNGLVVAGFGDFNYDARADLDGSAFINSNDSQLVRDQQSAIIYRSSGALVLQNPANRRDVDNDGNVSPLDVLIVINAINALNQTGEGEPPSNSKFFLDVTGDENLSPLDALTVINWLNGDSSGDVPFETGDGEGSGESSGEGEGEASPANTFAWTAPNEFLSRPLRGRDQAASIDEKSDSIGPSYLQAFDSFWSRGVAHDKEPSSSDRLSHRNADSFLSEDSDDTSEDELNTTVDLLAKDVLASRMASQSA